MKLDEKQKLELQKIFEEKYEALLKYAYFLTKYFNNLSQEDAEDCVMHGFVQLGENIDKVDPKGRYQWLRKTILHCMINEAERNRRTKPASQIKSSQANQNFIEQFVDPKNVSQEKKIMELEVNEKVRAALKICISQLPTNYRIVIELLLNGLAYKEIANLLDIPEGTVRVRLHRAIPLLKECLKNKGIEDVE